MIDYLIGQELFNLQVLNKTKKHPCRGSLLKTYHQVRDKKLPLFKAICFMFHSL